MTLRPDFWRLAVGAVAVAGALAVSGAPTAASAATAHTPYSALAAASKTCGTSRPHSGTTLYSGIRGGQGSLTVKNTLSQDSAVVVVLGRSKAFGVYVRAHARTTVGNVKPGTYTVYFTSGSAFSVCTGRFTEDASYWRVKKQLTFVAPPNYDVWTVTLYSVNGGNAPSDQISPSGFPAP
jgi:hypothetical protein